MGKPATYWEYIRVEELLSLQGGLDGAEEALSNDEVRFITIHQVDELWFKLALRELQATRDLFGRSHVPETSLASAATSLRRVALIFDLAARHFRLMETMRTQDYLSFRDKLSPASGFQSAQFREIEIVLGLEDADRIRLSPETSYLDAMRGQDGAPSAALERVRWRQRDQPTLKTAVYRWLGRAPINGSTPDSPGDQAVVDAFVAQFLACHAAALERLKETSLRAQAHTAQDEQRLSARYDAELAHARTYLEASDIAPDQRPHRHRVRAAILFIDSNRQLPLLSWAGEIIDALVELEQSLLVFRQRHARMVERVIGRRVGTGGSDGVDYLDRTALVYRIFTDIWAARTLLLPPAQSPGVVDAEFYGLRNQ